MQFIDSGRAACKSLLAIIDRKPEIDTRKSGKTLQNVRTLHFIISLCCIVMEPLTLEHSLTQLNGDIELEEVHFAYPTRPDNFVFNGFNLIIPAGEYFGIEVP